MGAAGDWGWAGRDGRGSGGRLAVFTAQETLVDDFIAHALKPVLWEEAEQQAAERPIPTLWRTGQPEPAQLSQ